MDGEFGFARHVVKSRCQPVDDGRRENPSDNTNHAQYQHQRSGDAIRQPKRFLRSFGLLDLGERRDESCRQSAFGEQVAQQIRNAKRGQESIVLQTGAKQRGEYLVAHQTEHPAGCHSETDDSGIARDTGAAVLSAIFVHNCR